MSFVMDRDQGNVLPTSLSVENFLFPLSLNILFCFKTLSDLFEFFFVLICQGSWNPTKCVFISLTVSSLPPLCIL